MPLELTVRSLLVGIVLDGRERGYVWNASQHVYPPKKWEAGAYDRCKAEMTRVWGRIAYEVELYVLAGARAQDGLSVRLVVEDWMLVVSELARLYLAYRDEEHRSAIDILVGRIRSGLEANGEVWLLVREFAMLNDADRTVSLMRRRLSTAERRVRAQAHSAAGNKEEVKHAG